MKEQPMADMKQLGESIVEVVKTFVAQQIGQVSKRIDVLHQRLDTLRIPKDITVEDVAPLISDQVKAAVSAIPIPENGKDADPEAVAQLVRAEVAKIPVPNDGKSVTVEDVAPLVIAEVSKAVAALPAPKNGKDADPLDQAEIVREVLAAVPQPKDGTSVTLADVAPLIEEQVKAAVAGIPAPQNGKDVEPAAVAELVRAEVAKIPPPNDGKSLTSDDVAPLIVAEVSKAVAAIPLPKDGKDVDHGAVVKDVLAAIRQPEDGKSVTTADVEPMLADLVAKAVNALPKPKDGESVPVDQVQKMIDAALSKAMAAVRMPADGRDAAHIEILPAIDAEKSYPRGTYAKHAGGQWRSFETTIGMRGWECIQNGVSAIEFEEHEDGRTLTEKHILSDGTVHARVRKSREMLYRGVFKEGEEYSPGDTVTWSGSLWYCNEPTKDKPIDGSKTWQLAAKRGRDGKDGINGKDFTKAVKL